MRRIASSNCSVAAPQPNWLRTFSSSESSTSIVCERSATIAESIVRERWRDTNAASSDSTMRVAVATDSSVSSGAARRTDSSVISSTFGRSATDGSKSRERARSRIVWWPPGICSGSSGSEPPEQPIITSASAIACSMPSSGTAKTSRFAANSAARPERELTQISVQPRSRRAAMVAPA